MQRTKKSAYQSLTYGHLQLFRIIEILPRNDDDQTNCLRTSFENHVPGGYCHLVNTVFYTMYLGYGIRMLLNHRFEVEYVCEMVIAQGLFSRYLVLYLQRWDLLELTETCRELWRTFVRCDEVEIVRAFERKVYFLRNFFLWNSLVAVTFYIMTAQFVRIPAVDGNATDTKILPFKFYVDVQEEPWYTLATVFQCVLSYSMTVILTGIETVAPFLVMMACGYFRTVCHRLMLMVTRGKVDVLPIDEVLVCVKFHQRILQFCEKIDKFTRGLFMIQVICTLYNMSLIGIKMLENDENAMKYGTILLLNLLQFFTCQWIPEHLLNESEAIIDAVYAATLVHRRFDARANHMLLLMIMRAGKPVQLTAGGIVRLSLESFKNMIVNAFSFFTMLRQFAT